MTVRRSTDRRALAALTAAGVLFGLTVPLSKLALGWLDAAWLAAARFALAAPALALMARGGLRRVAGRSVLAWGAVGYGGMVVVQNLGVERTSVSHAALIFGAVPALVALTSALAGRGAPGPLGWAGFLLALGGVGLVAGAGGDASPSGDALVLASALLSALFIVAQGRLLRGRDPVAVTAVQMAAAAVLATAAALPGGAPEGGPSGVEAAAVVALAAGGTLIPFALYAYGQARVAPPVAGAFVNLEPLVGAAVAVLVFANPFGPVQALGAAGILAGIILSSRRAGAPRRRQEILSSTIVFTANRIANRMVQRSRLRSISEPPVVPPATPTPKAPDIPASFPECRSTRKISTTAMKTCATESTVYIATPGYYGAGSRSSSASSRCSSSTASRRSWRSSARQSASDSLPVR
jgi:O-acetylserine/cysteine efflux transporter